MLPVDVSALSWHILILIGSLMAAESKLVSAQLVPVALMGKSELPGMEETPHALLLRYESVLFTAPALSAMTLTWNVTVWLVVVSDSITPHQRNVPPLA